MHKKSYTLLDITQAIVQYENPTDDQIAKTIKFLLGQVDNPKQVKKIYEDITDTYYYEKAGV